MTEKKEDRMMKVLFGYNETEIKRTCPHEVPMELLNEEWARRIHGQSLQRLNERGGLSPREIIGNIEKLSYSDLCNLSTNRCITKIKYLINHFKTNTNAK